MMLSASEVIVGEVESAGYGDYIFEVTSCEWDDTEFISAEVELLPPDERRIGVDKWQVYLGGVNRGNRFVPMERVFSPETIEVIYTAIRAKVGEWEEP